MCRCEYQLKITQKDVTSEFTGYLQISNPLSAWQLFRQSHLLLILCNQNAQINHCARMRAQGLEDIKCPFL